MAGVVEQIAIAGMRGALPVRAEHVVAHAGRGLEGEYHLAHDGSPTDPGAALTLIAAEQLEELRADTGIELSHEASRRNVLTRGIDLNALVGRRFSVGEVLCEGVELCEPCAGPGAHDREAASCAALVQRATNRARAHKPVIGAQMHVGSPARASAAPLALRHHPTPRAGTVA